MERTPREFGHIAFLAGRPRSRLRLFPKPVLGRGRGLRALFAPARLLACRPRVFRPRRSFVFPTRPHEREEVRDNERRDSVASRRHSGVFRGLYEERGNGHGRSEHRPRARRVVAARS